MGLALLRALTGGALLAGLFLSFPRALRAEARAVSVIDLHVDLAYRSLYKKRPFSQGSGEFRASSLLRAGVRGVVLPLYLPEDASPKGRTRGELERSYAHVFRSILQTRPYSLPGCAVRRAAGERREVETWLAFEGASPVGADLAEIRRWALRGVRSFGLVHAVENSLATSSGQKGGGTHGLTKQGRRFVEQVFQVKGLIDVSHASDRAISDALSVAKKTGGTVIATHSNARSLAPHPRNLSDEHIRAIAATGGVVGINFHQRFLSPTGGWGARMDDVVRQVRHLIRVGGPEVVALGSDFEGGIRPVSELASVEGYQNLARALKKAGFTRAQVEAVFWRNARRVLCPR